jgi:hypothetical protein
MTICGANPVGLVADDLVHVNAASWRIPSLCSMARGRRPRIRHPVVGRQAVSATRARIGKGAARPIRGRLQLRLDSLLTLCEWFMLVRRVPTKRTAAASRPGTAPSRASPG